MRALRNITLAAATAALAVSALGAPAAAAEGKGHLAIVNGIPGQKVDFCLNGKEIKSGVRYGGKKTLTINPGRKVLKIRKKAPGRCKGTQLGKRVVKLEAFGDFTFVATRKKTAKLPNKIVRFRNNDLGSLPQPSPLSGLYVLRHAADIGKVVFHHNEGGDYPQPAVTQPFVKGDQSIGSYFAGAHQFWATRGVDTGLVAAVFPLLAATPFSRYQFILVGTKVKNTRFVTIKQTVGDNYPVQTAGSGANWQPSTNSSKKSGSVSSSLCSMRRTSESSSSRRARDSNSIEAPRSAALPTRSTRSG